MFIQFKNQQFKTSCSLVLRWLRVKCWTPGWWQLMVVGQGESSGGHSFTTHCTAGLLFDAEVVPLAAEEMSCLLPFPYTPKPNEQRGALVLLSGFVSPLYSSFPLRPVSSLSPRFFPPGPSVNR
ncbi:hypothetical protein ATANTOWER_022798 [Ataeniobius toweri]|uniref:Uncharacterized protein n=1 Tax=Ataeniobius toweri TaxID=208326 RepID=A0ABU7CIM5_9TELE|nr:hypothetical protein [Ataeniobius toweri]